MKPFRFPWAKVGKSFLLVFLLFILAVSVGLWYLTTDSFQQLARRRMVAEIESATGGRVDIGSFHTVPLRLQVEVHDLTIHGKEVAGQQPYAHVDKMSAVLSLSAALGAKIGFHSLSLQHPVIHMIFYPDGSTNQPSPGKRASSSDLERLFSLSARRLEVRDGELLWQDQRIPLNFASDDVSANLYYSLLHLRYSGNVSIGKAETQFDGWERIRWGAQADFNLDRSGLQINSMRAVSGDSRLRATAVHFDFPTLTAQGKYDLDVDLSRASAISGEQELRAGRLSVTGAGSWSPKTFNSQGRFALRDAVVHDAAFSGRDLSGSGEFSLSPQKLTLTKVEGQFLRGSYSADAEITNWQALPSAPRNQEQQGAVKLRAHNLALSELLSGLGASFRPVKKLNLAGNLFGTVDVRWRRSIRYAQLGIAAESSPPLRIQNGQSPLTGSAQLTYDSGSGDMRLSQFTASTPSTQIRASGSLANSVRLSVSSTNVSEWQPLIAQLFPSGPPIHVSGHASFSGSASGKSSALKVAGNLQLQDFAIVLPPLAGRPKREMHWDSLSADVQASPSSLSMHNAQLRRPDAVVKVNGNVGLDAWNVVPSSPLHLHVDMQNADAGDFTNLVGYDHELSGKLTAQFQLSGTRSQPQGQGSFSLLNGAVHGQKFDSASASLSLNATKLAIAGMQMARGDARVNGSGTYDFSSRSIQLNIRGTNFALADIAPIEHSKISVAGKVDFSAQASGTTSAPEVTANLQIKDLVLNHQPEGNFQLTAASHGADVRVTGRSDFKDAELQIDGNVHLREQWPAHIGFHFSHLNADPFIESYLHNRTVRQSTIAGDLTLDGPLRSPKDLRLAGDLSDLYAEAGKTSFRNDGPIRFTLSAGGFNVDSFHLVGENTDLSGRGSMHITGDRSLDFQANGKVDLKLIQSYDPDITSSGFVTGNGSVSGTLDAPLIKGKLQIENGAIADINLPSALSDINGTLLFNQNQVTIDNLNAHVGGGSVGFSGRAELVGRQLNFDLRATADAVRLRYPPGVSSTANAQLTWTGSSAASSLAGEITVTKLAFTPGFDFGAYLERTAQVSSLPQTDPVLNKIRLDLHVVTTPELQMQTSVIRLQGSADLRVRGSAAKPILLGRADVFEGEAYFNGTKYRLERGGVTFSNPAVTTPFLDLEAVTRVRDYDVTLALTGDISKPNGLKVNYRSDPPLPTADIIALLAFGQTTEESAQLQQTSQSAFSQQASSAMLAAALNATLNNRAQRLFGNSRIKIDPQGLESETSTITQNGPAVTIEQQVKDNLTLSYTTDVSQTSQQVIRAEYNVSKNVSIVAIRDQNGVVSFDVKIRRRKR